MVMQFSSLPSVHPAVRMAATLKGNAAVKVASQSISIEQVPLAVGRAVTPGTVQ